MSGNIILIGMPGSGKSTVGVLLAKAAGMRFSDTDLLIQQETGKKPSLAADPDYLRDELRARLPQEAPQV